MHKNCCYKQVSIEFTDPSLRLNNISNVIETKLAVAVSEGYSSCNKLQQRKFNKLNGQKK